MSLDDRMQDVRSLTRSFACAFRGVWYCIAVGRNMRIHLVTACYVLVFSVFYRFSAAEYAVLLLTIGAVLAAETFNTAVEAVVNMETPHYDPMARAAKDTAAGAVLITALAALAVGLVLFWRPAVLWGILCFLVSHMFWGVLFLASLPVTGLFIFFFPMRKKVRRLRSVR